METALPVEDVDFDASVEHTGDLSNMSAEEYLAWVRYQAGTLPDVARASIDTQPFVSKQTKYIPTVEQVSQCDESLLPDDSWESEVIFSFSQLRGKLQLLSADEKTRERKVQVPQLKDNRAWYAFCYGKTLEEGMGCNDLATHVEIQLDDEISQSLANKKRKLDHEGQYVSTPVSEKESVSHTQDVGVVQPLELQGGSPEVGEITESVSADIVTTDTGTWAGAVDVSPKVALLLQFDQVMTQKLLTYHAQWIKERVTPVSRTVGQWVYALLARLEKPIHQDMAAILRDLYRSCTLLRSEMSPNTFSERDDAGGSNATEISASEIEEPSLESLNIIISLSGAYFGQGEEYVGRLGGASDDDKDCRSNGAEMSLHVDESETVSRGDEEDNDENEEGTEVFTGCSTGFQGMDGIPSAHSAPSSGAPNGTPNGTPNGAPNGAPSSLQSMVDAYRCNAR